MQIRVSVEHAHFRVSVRVLRMKLEIVTSAALHIAFLRREKEHMHF